MAEESVEEANPFQAEAIREENEALQQALNNHLQNRVVALKVRVKELEAEIRELKKKAEGSVGEDSDD